MITVKNPTDSRRFYIGVRSCNGKPEEDTYWGSSVHFKKWQKENGTHGLEKQVLACWPSREEANSHEILLQDCFNIPANMDFWNRAKTTSSGFSTAGLDLPNKYKKGQVSPRKGVKLTQEQIEKARLRKLGAKHSEKTKLLMSQKSKGRLLSAEARKKISDVHRGRVLSEETKQKIRQANIGNKHSQQTKEKMSASRTGEKFYNNGIVCVRCKPEAKPDGFVNGLLKRKPKNVHA
jgi:hypothetical protein